MFLQNVRFTKPMWLVQYFSRRFDQTGYLGKASFTFFVNQSIWKYDLDLLNLCANPALHKEISNFGYICKNGG